MKILFCILFPFLLKSQISDFDKHQYVSFGLCVVSSIPIYKCSHNCKQTCLQSFEISFGLGLGKEIVYDKILVLGSPSFVDGVADLKGSLTGLFCVRVGIDMHEKKKHKNFWYE